VRRTARALFFSPRAGGRARARSAPPGAAIRRTLDDERRDPVSTTQRLHLLASFRADELALTTAASKWSLASRRSVSTGETPSGAAPSARTILTAYGAPPVEVRQWPAVLDRYQSNASGIRSRGAVPGACLRLPSGDGSMRSRYLPSLNRAVGTPRASRPPVGARAAIAEAASPSHARRSGGVALTSGSHDRRTRVTDPDKRRERRRPAHRDPARTAHIRSSDSCAAIARRSPRNCSLRALVNPPRWIGPGGQRKKMNGRRGTLEHRELALAAASSSAAGNPPNG